MTAPAEGPTRDDRVRPATRRLGLVIWPVLVVAFVVLWPVPTSTDRLFAWHILPTMTPMVLGSAYLGGAWFFWRVWREENWSALKLGFVPVALFASLLGVATIVHWDRFDHDHLAFWLWAGLYFTTPFLVLGVLLANRRHERPADPGEARLPGGVRLVAGGAGVGATALGTFLTLAPARAAEVWPWAISPLTGRVVGAVLMLGVAGIGLYLDPRWSVARLVFRVEQVMIAALLVAGVRAHDEFDTGRPLTWLLAAGLLFLLAGSAVVEVRMRGGVSRGSRTRSPSPRRAAARPA